MKLYFLNYLFVFLGLTHSVNSQQIQLKLVAPPEFKSIQLLSYETPFDDNVVLLADLEANAKGEFEHVISSPKQLRVAIKVGEATRDLILSSGYWYNIAIEVQKIDRPIEFSYVVIAKAESNNKIFEALFKIEKDIDALAKRNTRSNGKYSSNYSTELFDYWSKLLIEQKNDHESDLVNSKIFASSASTVRKLGSIDQFRLLEGLFVKNFSYSPAGFQALNSLYVNNLHFDFVSRHLDKMSYIQFVDQELNKIKEMKIKSAVELALVSEAIGGKWANQVEVLKRLQSIIDTTPSVEIKEYAVAIKVLHDNKLIGREIENFKTLNFTSDTISFSDFKGKFLLIDFWATWCGPCVKSMRKLPALKAEFESKLDILCITFETDKEKVGRFIERNNYQNSLKFGFAVNKKLMDSYFDIRAIPLYYLVNPQGIIIDKAVGEPFEMLKKHLK